MNGVYTLTAASHLVTWTYYNAGVTGNQIRAYTDPGGLDPLVEQIHRIGFVSGSDPPPDQFDKRIRSFAAKTIRLWYKYSVKKKITSCQDDVWFFNTSRTFYNFGDSWKSTTRWFATTSTAGSPSSRNGRICKPQANKLKKFVNEDGILHYITKEWMHKCFHKKEMQPFPLTQSSHQDSPLHRSYLPLSDRQVTESLPMQEQWNCNMSIDMLMAL